MRQALPSLKRQKSGKRQNLWNRIAVITQNPARKKQPADHAIR